MNKSIRQEVHKLVDNCEDEILMEDVRELLQTGRDWWKDLSPADQSLVMESEAQYEKGYFIDHQELLSRFEEWKKK